MSVKVLAIATAGFAKEVEEVNQYPAVIKVATDEATASLPLFKDPNITKINPKVAMISAVKIFIPGLIFCESCNKGRSNIKFANITPNMQPKI